MDGPSLLNEHLASWASEHAVTLAWIRGTLRLQSPAGEAGAVVSFPPDFWERFSSASQERRTQALDAIRLSVELQYRPPLGQYAHVIEVENSLLDER